MSDQLDRDRIDLSEAGISEAGTEFVRPLARPTTAQP